MKNKKVPTIFIWVLVIYLPLLSCVSKETKYDTLRGNIFGTTYSIKLYYDSLSTVHDGIKKRLNRVNETFSTYLPSSMVSRINNNEDVLLNEHFRKLFALAQKVSVMTDGTFDITVGPLVNAWGFGRERKIKANDSIVKEIKSYVGYEKISINNNRLVKTSPRTQLDFSAIAKGYGVDVVCEYLDSLHVEHYSVEIGGEVKTKGVSPRGDTWKIGVAVPTASQSNKMYTILSLKNQALATSGNYRNYHLQGGKRIAHEIDPHTGYHKEYGTLSASVISSSCALSDALATAYMLMPAKRVMELASEHEVEVFLIYRDSTSNQMTTYKTKSIVEIES